MAVVHVPGPAEPGTPLPVVLDFHGLGSDPADQAGISGIVEASEREGFVAVHPAGLGDLKRWTLALDGAPDDLEFISDLLDRIEATFCIDTTRVYAMGFSMGGTMVAALACALPHRIAAVATVSAAHGPAWDPPCGPRRVAPTLAMHGLLDPLLPYLGGPNPLRELGLPPVIGFEDWSASWADGAGCDPEPVMDEPLGAVQPLTWQACSSDFVTYIVGDGGHAWPGGTGFEAFGRISRAVSATYLALEFFNAHPLRAS